MVSIAFLGGLLMFFGAGSQSVIALLGTFVGRSASYLLSKMYTLDASQKRLI